MKRMSVMIMAVIFAMIVAACAGGSGNNDSQTAGSTPQNPGDHAAGDTVVVTHELGETVVPKNPERVVVFDFGSLDTLDKLGVEVLGVPQASVPGYLSKYAGEEYVNVGSLKEPDFETIYGLQPDLIIISSRQMAMYEELSEIANTIYLAIDQENYMESFKSNAMVLGEIFGQEEVVAEELAKIEDGVARLNDAMSTSEEEGLIVLVTGGKISVYGPGSRYGIIHDAFGVKPVDESIDASTHGMSVSFEYIAEKDPDYLFVVDRDAVVGDAEAAAASSVLNNDLVRDTKAAQNDRIIYLSPDYWYLSGGGLVSVSEMLKEIEEAIQ